MKENAKSGKRRVKAKPILLKSWIGDYYNLGVFCQKAGLVEYAQQNIRFLRGPTQKNRLFLKGVAEADDYTMADIAYEVAQLRSLTGSRFDRFINGHCGFRTLMEIKNAIRDAHDWETEEQKRNGQEILSAMFAATGNRRDREKGVPFAEGYPVAMEFGRVGA